MIMTVLQVIKNLGPMLFAFSVTGQAGLEVYAQQSPMPEGGPGPFTSTGQLLLFLTTICGFAAQIIQSWLKQKWDRETREAEAAAQKAIREAEERERRMQREWDLEDRRHAREQADRKASELARKTEQTAKDITEKLEEKSTVLLEKVAENTEISQKAFNEANNFNNKLRKITEQFAPNMVSDGVPDVMQTMKNIENTTEETKEKVDDIHEALNDATRESDSSSGA